MKLNRNERQRRRNAWSSFRLSVVGHLLAAPPARGELKPAIEALAARTWRHPITDCPVQFAFSTIEQWLYQARNAKHDPVKALRRKTRKDRGGFRCLKEDLRRAIRDLHSKHPGWTHQLHYDNLVVVANVEKLSKVPSYATVRRYRSACGLLRVPRPKRGERAGILAAIERFENFERRRYEASHVLGLVHSDFHHCSRKVLNEHGEWVKPVLVSFIDDRSRLICHAQWYWDETAENFVHGLSQAILKRGLPRSLMTDNGSPMTAGETTQGLERLGVLHETTLPYSPYQNGKQESFWGQIEGRLMPMLEDEEALTLTLLNEATVAFIEMDYHRRVNSETGQTPIDRFLDGPDVGRPSPQPEKLREAFTVETTRKLRRSDCTISLENQRYEVPSRFRHLKRVSLRYATWDLSRVRLVCDNTGDVIGYIYPPDLEENASGHRRRMEPVENTAPVPATRAELAPLLRKHIEDYAATGLPMGYLPKDGKTN